MKQPVDHMKYMEGMEVISSEVMDRVIADREAYDPSYYTAAHVQSAWGGNMHPRGFRGTAFSCGGTVLGGNGPKSKNGNSKTFW